MKKEEIDQVDFALICARAGCLATMLIPIFIIISIIFYFYK